MNIFRARLFAALAAFCLFAGGASAVTDNTWGEAWNSASVIGIKNMTISSNQKWGSGQSTAFSRGAATELFDNVNDANNDLIHTTSSGSCKLWVKVTIGADCQTGKDIVLKKYRVCAGTNARAPKTWAVYGAASADAAWGDDSLVLLDSRLNVAGTTTADYDCSGNVTPYRTYFIYIESNNGDGLLQISEWYLFGEIKDHEEKILYSVSTPYAGYYDGNSHGITVTASYPATGVTVEYSANSETWEAESPVYKSVGDYTVYYRLTATGFPTETGSRAISIATPPQENLDITATVREAESASGESHHATTAAQAFGGSTEFTDGINNQRIGWANAKPDGSNTLTYEIYETYRPGDQVTVTGLTFLTGSGVDHSATDSMRAWKFEAWDAANGEWKELVSRTAEEWPAWSSDELDSSLGAYVRSCFFENSFVSRKYRLTTYSRTFLSDLRILGNVIMVDISKIRYLSANYKGTYDGEAHGIAVTVQNPDEGYTVSYRALPSGEWTTTNPTFVGPILASEAQQVEFNRISSRLGHRSARGRRCGERFRSRQAECLDCTA